MVPENGPAPRGGSDAVGIVLLVAVTIVLAAMVSTVVLDMGQDTDGNSLAGAAVDFREESDSIRVVYTTMDRPGTELEVTVTNRTNASSVGAAVLSSVGESATFDAGVADGHAYGVVVVARWRSQRSVVLTATGVV